MEPLSFENTKDDDSLKKKKERKTNKGCKRFTFLFCLPTKNHSPITSPSFMYIVKLYFFPIYTNIFTFVYRHKNDLDKEKWTH